MGHNVIKRTWLFMSWQEGEDVASFLAVVLSIAIQALWPRILAIGRAVFYSTNWDSAGSWHEQFPLVTLFFKQPIGCQMCVGLLLVVLCFPI